MEIQTDRYARQIIMKEIGPIGQKKLSEAKIFIIGAGGLGSPVALYLASAGVGTLGIADDDVVDISNLQRQILHSEKNLGKNKTDSAKEMLQNLNSKTKINIYKCRVNSQNIGDLIADYDFIIDASDNFETKFLINDACVINHKPYCHAGISKFSGQIMTYIPEKSPCLRCFFRNPPDNNAFRTCTMGVIGAVCGIIGSMQALEAVKYITGSGDLLTGNILTFDGLSMNIRKVKFPIDCNCPVCGKNPKIFLK